MTERGKLFALGLGALAVVIAVYAVSGPIHQDLAYHGFADAQAWAGIPNAANVLSNAPFVAVGLWGLIVLVRGRETIDPRLWLPPYAIYLFAIAWVGFGSAWYHWAPDNDSLVWDRLPMSVAFMALLDALIADRVGNKAGQRMLVPLLLLGAGSVFYWAATDDLRPYGLIQFLPIAIAGALCAMFPARAGLKGRFLVSMFVLYGVAKLLEVADMAIWQATGQMVSGHSLKHFAAAASAAPAVLLLRRGATSP